jgi:hypothetical protein
VGGCGLGFGKVWFNFMILTLLPAFLSLYSVLHVHSLCLPRILDVVDNRGQSASSHKPQAAHGQPAHQYPTSTLQTKRQSVQKSGVNSLISLSSSRISRLKTRLVAILPCGVRSSFSSPVAPAATPILLTRWPR